MGKSFNLEEPKKSKRDSEVAPTVDGVELQVYAGGKEKTRENGYQEKEVIPRISLIGIFRFARQHDYLLMTIGAFFAITHGVMIQVNFLILAGVIDVFIAGEAGENGTDSGGDLDLNDEIQELVWQFCVTASVVLLAGYIHMMCWCTTAERQTRVIRTKAFQSVLRQHMGWFDRHQSGELNTRMTSDVLSIQAGMGDKVATFIQWTSTFVGGMTICLIRGWQLTLVMLSLSPLPIITGGVVARMMQTFATKELETYAKAGAVAEEVLGSIRTVAAYGGENKEALRYNKQLELARRQGIKRGIASGIGQGTLWFVIFAIISFAFWYGAKLVREEDYSIGVVLQVQFSLFTGTRAMGQAVSNLEAFSIARGAAATVFHIIGAVSEIDSSSDSGLRPAQTRGVIGFNDVDFGYPTRPEARVLSSFDLEINPGQTVALVGPSGCGKSTAVQLLQRFYDPDQGTVTLDSVNVKDLNVRWLRQQIGVVSQEPILFATTIAENIRLGRDGVTQQEIEQAAKEANAHNFVMKLPQKYDTMVGSKGGQMSGGQKQRIAIARALVRNPKILILDDATSALDYQSESIVQDALDKARMGRTTLVIAHRLSTIRNADVICVLDNGSVVERGTHDDLVQRGGLYYNLISNQVEKDDEDEEDDDGLDYDDGDIDDVIINGSVVSKSPDGKGVLDQDLRSRASSRLSKGGSIRGSKRKRKVTISEEEPEVVEEEIEIMAPASRIFRMNAPEWPYIVVGCVAAVVQGSVFPLLASFSSEILGAFTLTDIDEQIRQINLYIIVLMGLGVAAGMGMFTMIAAFNTSGEKLTSRMRDLAFRAMLRQEIGWFDDKKNQVGSLTARLATDASMVKSATGAALSNAINASSTLILSLVIMFVFGWKLAFVDLAFMPPLIIMGMVQTRMLVGFARGSKEATEEGGKIVSEAIENIRTVASLTKEDFFLNRYNDHFIKAFSDGRRRAHVFGLTWGLSQAFLFFSYAANFGFGGWLVQQGEMEFTNVFRVFVTMSASAVEAGRVNAFISDYSKAKVSAARLFGLFDRRSHIDPMDPSGEQPASCQGDVEFRGVKFRYPTRRQVQILQGLNVAVKPGQCLALVGSSGCGKSTTVGLLERFYDPEEGLVLVDGKMINTLNTRWVRSQISIVAQEPVLFDATIKENITYGDQSRDIPMDEVIAAARMANIHHFIETLPQGYDTPVGGTGAQLVGGQKQRIAIARALIRNPKILLLDEATSALDTENERVVQEALERAQQGRTSIVIAHRLSTIEGADIIAVIDNGKVVEQGNHHELMAMQGLYYMLQQIQSGNRDAGKE